ncbi:centromere protein J [Phymastichus coffea]|uniref:centromere protein J n=1 Tax=Phymastichus coffea TaxID=108790 RepID=UPI00273AC555|nr:centromere protein J [Phymastichus coffea]
MAVEASIVEQLQELRRWQLQQQQELIKKQQEQRELLTNEQNRLYEALSLSVDEMSLNSDSLKEIIEEQKVNGNLIDLEIPDEDEFKTPKSSHSFSQFNPLSNENNNSNGLILNVPKLQLVGKTTKSDVKQNIQHNNSYNQNDYSSELSILDSSQPYFLDKLQRQSAPIDEMPVPSPKKDFITLLEEKLKDSTEVVTESKNKPIVKRPFLKKGEGLVRYMPNANPNKISRTTRGRSASFSCETRNNNIRQPKKTNLGRCNSLPRSKKTDVPRKPLVTNASVAQQKLTLKNIPPPKKKSRNKSIGFLPSPTEKKKLLVNVSDSNTSDLEVKSKKEMEEVRIFELLEDKAENSSFCSTSSTIIAFMQQSTPLKHKALLHSASKNKISLSDIGDETLDELVKATKLNYHVPQSQKSIKHKTPDIPWDEVPISTLNNKNTASDVILPYGTDIDEKYEDDISNKGMDENENNVSLHVRFAEYNEYKTMTDTSSIASDSQVNVNYVSEKGAWSDFSVNTDSSDIENLILSELKKKLQNNNNILETPRCVQSSQYDTDEDATEDFKNGEGDNDNENVEDENELKDETIQEENGIVIDENNANHSIFKSELLKTRLQELEREIEIFRKESAALTFQRQKLQEERTKLQEERLSLQRSYEEKEKTLEIEKKRTENHLQEEKKRLNREKTALESRMKDAWDKAQKSKQERQEIEKLREQIEELKEELSQKESKWSASNARQRSQMRVLQTENSKLKQELEKQQQKKNVKSKKPTTNTRAIHQINKFLADRKKISPFKNEDDCNEEIVKATEPANVAYDDLDLEPVELDEFQSKNNKSEKVKTLKSAESIARTRNLYESLLREATGCLSENYVERKNLLNQQKQNKVQDSVDHSDKEEHNYKEVQVNEIRTSPKRKNSKSPEKEQQESENYNDHGNHVGNPKPICNKQGIREVHHSDGRVEYWYPNGNVKKIFPNKCLTKMIYYNGDVRETDKNGRVKYFYASTRTWHTTMPDGLEILEFPDGQVERRSKDGTIEVTFPDESVRIVQADGSEKWILRDGTIAETSSDGEKILTLPNGQREIHTKDHKRREYPDGTVKLVYVDGIQETRYANGRVRLKDKDGNLIMDTHQ